MNVRTKKIILIGIILIALMVGLLMVYNDFQRVTSIVPIDYDKRLAEIIPKIEKLK